MSIAKSSQVKFVFDDIASKAEHTNTQKLRKREMCMKVRKGWEFPVAFSWALLSTIFFQTASYAATRSVVLSGDGPVVTRTMSPGNRQVTVSITTYNNLNVGWDLIDQGSGDEIANGTITDQGTINRPATTHAGRTYRLRLRCQEPIWNKTKCHAKGTVSW
jgi:hypothetical protein